jgi:hypothetical protein
MFSNRFVIYLLREISKEYFDLLKLNKKEQEAQLSLIEKSVKKLDYINRTFAQYKCQNLFYSKLDKFILNVSSVLLLFPFLIFALSNYYFIKLKAIRYNNYNLKESTAVFFGLNRDIIPESLKKYKIVDSKFCFTLDFRSLFFLMKNVYLRFFYYPYFCLKITVKVALYNANIVLNSPKILIVTSEYSFTSSILTLYCEINNCEHINVMHGEKLFYIRDSFFKFHKCYVWHEHYVNLFKKLNAEENKFIVELPYSFNFKNALSKNKSESEKKFFKYFLGGETKEQLYQLSNFLKSLQKKFYVVVRPHPLDSNMEEVTEIFNGIQIENSKEMSIIDSLLSADFVSALYSTVLFQGYCMGKEIVINDLDRKMYEKLKELDFIGLNLPHLLLTDFLGD